MPSPTKTQKFGPVYTDAVKHLTTSLSTSTWGSWLPGQTEISATDTDDPYGQAAWSSMWLQADLHNYTTTGLFSTTVSPTPVPSSELVLPPPDYFGPTDCYTFPKDFVFGVAGSAAQIEGAIGLEGRSPSLLEKLVSDSQPKDYVTNENYFLYKQDIQRLAAMGVEYYSFTIPWTRILPFVHPGTPVNQQAIDHYDDLIDTILEAGMKPVVTMLHFDSPLMFVADDDMKRRPDIGYNNAGYQNETFVDAFVNYGKVLLSHYADRVPIWVTFNEPLLYAFNFKGVDHVVKAHAQVYRFYRDTLKATGKMGIKFNDNFGVPKDPKNASHVLAADRFQEMQLGIFGNPIFLGKQYPESVLKTLPGAKPLSKAELKYIGKTSDFFGVDPYTATVVSPPDEGIDACAASEPGSNSLLPYCVTQEWTNVHGWNIGYRSGSYVYITPTHFREYLFYLWNTFKSPVFVSEFGFPVYGESTKEALSDQLFDSPRSVYYLSFMSEILKSIYEDGVHVMGALAWSFVDNWEFGDYSQQFGIQAVNRTTQQRYYKKSFFDLVDFVRTRQHKKN
ncbi:Glycoside hydrolase family 1 [Penicillium bovifimosum]|uniref:Glycoside hydrolase family 1 n=1 Tax=Penicillium bovifimosum TaxID=126998 RepID=A0A9W9GVH2_9EURO|nr:Glycoside hydrolase family 1 [Penicillium bovifimosum]KAJ5129969.1 Glycoside hydrolase family 1 [Penicillium bovifimosum]